MLFLGTLFLALLLIVAFASASWNFFGKIEVDLGGNCTVNFVPNKTTPEKASSMDQEEWNYIAKRCKEQWKTFKKENTVAELVVGGNYSQLVVELYYDSKEDLQRKLVVIFAYELTEPTILGKFCFAMKETNISNQCFADVYKRITMHNRIEQAAVLGFWYYFILAADQNNLPINSSDSVQNIITLITSEIDRFEKKPNFWKFFELGK
jgi:hypothetical protein